MVRVQLFSSKETMHARKLKHVMRLFRVLIVHVLFKFVRIERQGTLQIMI